MRSETRKSTFTQAARQTQIVNAAIDVIAEIGWAQTSIRKIADKVGIAMSAVLYHFGTKDNLVDAIVEQMYRAALAAVAPAVQAQHTSAGKLTAYITATIAYYDSHRTHLAALAQLSAGYQPADGRRFDELGMTPELREELTQLDPTAILVAGQHDNEFGDFPIESMATALRGAVNAAVEKILRDPDFDANAYADDLVDIFRHAVTVQR
ncbi:helix-turn-helix domain-containing protein [Mycobacterium avium subsp. hominissuis]|uniref:TetR/AcrR family transcriptional regulator n=1 Tax=Mycobacterium avium TaxID=1764 RepID=UPI002666E01C|nr:helix-turn-helix domain-containing protein [Mycobacterium avium]MDO2396112.1 helix-turn-helix domain-containing protein [Mycobacterium avium subsp. hominissuis]